MGTYSSLGRERKGMEVTDAILQRLIPIVTAIQSSWNRTECLNPLCFLWHCALCCDALWFKDWRISEFPASQPIRALSSVSPTPPKSFSSSSQQRLERCFKKQRPLQHHSGMLIHLKLSSTRSTRVFVSPWEYCNQLRVFFRKLIVKNGRQTSVVLLALFTSVVPLEAAVLISHALWLVSASFLMIRRERG